MVTTSIVAGGGADYTTIASWEANETGAGDIGEIDDNSTYAENVTISGGGGGRILRTGSSNHHDGTAGSASSVDPSSNGHAFTVSEDNFTAEGLEITGLSGNSSEAFRVNNTGLLVDKCIIHDLTASGNQDGIYAGADSITIKTRNTIFYNIERGCCHVQGFQSVTWHIHNCTGWEGNQGEAGNYCGFGFDDNSGKNNNGSIMYCDNVSSHGSGTRDAFHGGGSSGNEGAVHCENCSSDDTTSTSGGFVTDVGGNRTNEVQADQFVSLTASSEDFHLKTGSDLEDAGKDLSSDSDLAVTDDIDYITRTGTFDIGADEFVAAAAGFAYTQGSIIG